MIHACAYVCYTSPRVHYSVAPVKIWMVAKECRMMCKITVNSSNLKTALTVYQTSSTFTFQMVGTGGQRVYLNQICPK
jgi:hypothetical protein